VAPRDYRPGPARGCAIRGMTSRLRQAWRSAEGKKKAPAQRAEAF